MALKFLFIFTVSLRSFHFLICKTWFACEDLQLRVGRKNVILCWHLAHLANNHLSVTGKPFLSDECMSLPSWLPGWPSFGSWLQLLPVRGVCIHCVSFCSACAQPFWDSLFAASISLPLVSVALLGCEFLCVLEEFLLLPCEEMLRSHYIFMLLWSQAGCSLTITIRILFVFKILTWSLVPGAL